MKPAPLTYAEKIALARAKYKALIPPAPTPTPVEAPIEPWFEMLGKRLSPDKHSYLVAVVQLPQNFTFLVRVNWTGAPGILTRHYCEVWFTPNRKAMASEVMEASHPYQTFYTKPFLFHSETDAQPELLRAIKSEIRIKSE